MALSFHYLSCCFLSGLTSGIKFGMEVRVQMGSERDKANLGRPDRLLNEVAPKHPLPDKSPSLHPWEYTPNWNASSLCTAWVLVSARGLDFVLHGKT